jgi:hypothetical protein
MLALLTSTIYSIVLSSKSVPVGFDDAEPIAHALKNQPKNYSCNSILQMYSLAATINDGSNATAESSSKQTCNTVVNYINRLCTGHGNMLLLPQGFTIAAVVLFLVGVWLHLLLTAYLILAVVYFVAAAVSFGIVIALIHTLSGSITEKPDGTCDWVFYSVN